MTCSKCHNTLPDNSKFCNLCGKKLVREQKTRVRGNGTGSVYQLPNKKWRAVVTLGYYADEKGKQRRRTVSRSDFTTKRDAVNYLPQLKDKPKPDGTAITFKELYDMWIPTHQKHNNTTYAYSSAINHFKAIWNKSIADIGINDLQQCMDECTRGRQTHKNLRTLARHLYKYGIPRGYILHNINHADFLTINIAETDVSKTGFSESDFKKIERGVGVVPRTEYIYALIYLGFRANEFLSLDISKYNIQEKAITGGFKTKAGTDRIVTISPKIQTIVDNFVNGRKSGTIFCDENGAKIKYKTFLYEYFFATLDMLGIDNPERIVNGRSVRKYTPHSCRRTFATLAKKVDAPEKDKLKLIGHTSGGMLRYYQDVDLKDLRKITDRL